MPNITLIDLPPSPRSDPLYYGYAVGGVVFAYWEDGADYPLYAAVDGEWVEVDDSAVHPNLTEPRVYHAGDMFFIRREHTSDGKSYLARAASPLGPWLAVAQPTDWSLPTPYYAADLYVLVESAGLRVYSKTFAEYVDPDIPVGCTPSSVAFLGEWFVADHTGVTLHSAEDINTVSPAWGEVSLPETATSVDFLPTSDMDGALLGLVSVSTSKWTIYSRSGVSWDSVIANPSTGGYCPGYCQEHGILMRTDDFPPVYSVADANAATHVWDTYATESVIPPGRVAYETFRINDQATRTVLVMDDEVGGNPSFHFVDFDLSFRSSVVDAAAVTDALAHFASFYAIVREAIRSTSSVTLQAAYSQALTETALGHVVVASGKYFEDMITEAITGNVGMALALGAQLIEQAQASDVPASLRQLVVDVAEVIVALSSLSVGQTYDFLETASANDTVADRITALALILESVLASDTPDAALTLMSVIREDAEATDTPTPLAAHLALITEAANAGVLLKLGDDYYVGWVLNPGGMQTKNGPAPTVSQYQNYPFNSLAKIGSRYYAAGAEGLYELTGSNDAGAPIIGYFKSGKLDFGSAMQKRVDSAYFAVATDGTVRLKVVTHEDGENLETWYEVVSRDAGEVAENIRIKLGKGLRSRYWQFELVVEDASHFELEEMQLIPMMLTRRL